MTSLRERFEESEQFRRGVLGGVSGALAGMMLTLLGGSTPGDFLVAIFVGIVTFVALWLLTT